MKKKSLVILAGLIAIAVVGAVFAKTTLMRNNAQSQISSAANDKVTKEQAKKIALKKVTGEIVGEEDEKEDGKTVFSFDIKRADGSIVEVRVDQMTGKILDSDDEENESAEKSDDNDEDMESDDVESSDEMNAEEGDGASEATLMKQAKITKAEAEKIALKRAPGKVESGELENENKKLVFSFDIRNKKGTISEVQVDAKTGKIVSVEEEDAAKEAAEAKEDAKKNVKPSQD